MATSQKIIAAIKAIVGARGWIEDAPGKEPYLIEERGQYRGTCDLVVKPASTDEVADIVRLCTEAGVAIVPQGGNTGLVGGGIPDGGIVISTERLNRICEIDALNLTMTVQAGCILADIQAAADEIGGLFPLSLAAEGSCRIGGNISTNAGGVGVLRYGNTRDMILGLEVVLPGGRIWNGLRGLRKDNTGYDLKQLFIGSEGTLGIITAAVLKLHPRPNARELAFCAVADPHAALKLYNKVRAACGDELTAFELMSRFGIEIAVRHLHDVTDPFSETHPFYVLLELSSQISGPETRRRLESVLAAALDSDVIIDAVIGESIARSCALWAIRDGIPEAQKKEGGSIKHDVSVPVSRVPDFLARATDAVEAETPGIRVCAFGHMGDGNIHFNLTQPEAMDRDQFMSRQQALNRLVFDIVVDMGGSFSAEHGIGLLRRGDLARYRDDVERDLMRAVKGAIDPQNVMNPGKIIPPDSLT